MALAEQVLITVRFPYRAAAQYEGMPPPLPQAPQLPESHCRPEKRSPFFRAESSHEVSSRLFLQATKVANSRGKNHRPDSHLITQSSPTQCLSAEQSLPSLSTENKTTVSKLSKNLPSVFQLRITEVLLLKTKFQG